MTVTGVRLLWNKSNIATPIPAMENPYPREINHTNFLKPMALITIATTNKMRNFIVCTLFFIVMIALGRGIVKKRTIDGSNSIEI